MSSWNPQLYRAIGARKKVPADTLDNAVTIIERVQKSDPRMMPVFTLRHLAHLTEVKYGFLRLVVARKIFPYKTFTLKKFIPGRTKVRTIRAANENMKAVQQWIVGNILRYTKAHPTSFAYHPGSRPELTAQVHCGCDFLLKIDIEDFFHHVSEATVFKIFHKLGYSKLMAFELARLTTIVGNDRALKTKSVTERWPAIPGYHCDFEGYLPQGASTSPMPSNLAMVELDERFTQMAEKNNLKYTRYADDLVFSGRKPHTRDTIAAFRRKVMKELLKEGYRPNGRKTQIRGPGARRIVLGLMVDGPEPRLSKEFKSELRQHLHYISSPNFGPSKHATAKGTSVSTLHHRIRGLIGWALRVEPKYGAECLKEFEAVTWPPIDFRSPRRNAVDDEEELEFDVDDFLD